MEIKGYKDFYKQDKLSIYNMDNMELMKQIPDKYFDLAIVDPPYGIGFDSEKIGMSGGIRKDGSQRYDKTWANRKITGYLNKQWDSAIPKIEYFLELKRISKNQIIWGGNYMTDFLKPHGGWIVWEKGVPDGMTLSQAELAYNTCLNSINIVKILWAGYKKQVQETRIHPTQKPVSLYSWILEKYAKEGMKIFDSHLGSGSNAIACHYAKMEFIGCELDSDYYNDSVKRIRENTKQLQLF